MHYFTLLYQPDGTLNGPCCATHLDEGGWVYITWRAMAVRGHFCPHVSISLPPPGSRFGLRSNQKFNEKSRGFLLPSLLKR